MPGWRGFASLNRVSIDPPHPPPRRVLAVDDHEAARRWLVDAARGAFPEATLVEVPDCRRALEALQVEPFDLLLLDLGLPDASGLTVLETLQRSRPACPCVVTTVFDDDEHLFAALRAGAAGYVLKDQSRDELSRLLKDMLAGRPPLSPGIARRLLHHFSAASGTPQVPAAPELTGREQDVLRIVAKGMSIREAADLLAISPHTVHTHVRTVYRKLAVATRAEAALAASRLGLV